LASRCVATPLVRSYRTISPLPRFAKAMQGGVFLCHFPSGRPAWVLPSALPYGARTFLPRLRGSGRVAHSTAIVPHERADRQPSSASMERLGGALSTAPSAACTEPACGASD